MKDKFVAGVMVLLYLGAIILANLSSTHFGPQASIYNAFLFIGLTLSTRDYLNELWGKHRRRNMMALILTGSAISYAAVRVIAVGPPDLVARIALASCVAFVIAETVDWLRFETLDGSWRDKAWISNAFSAPIDSVIFVSIAFGFSWEIVVAQTCAKFFGGFVWAAALDAIRTRRRVAYA